MKDSSLPSLLEAKAPELARFKQELLALDGRAIPVKFIPHTQPLFLTAQYFGYPFAQFEEEQIQKNLSDNDGILFISLHEKPDPISEPVGFIDWDIKNGVATVESWHESYNPIHQRVLHSIDSGELSDWIELVAFYVRKEYARNGLGSLLLATSTIALESLDASTLRTSRHSVTEQASSFWEKFGLEKNIHGQSLPLYNVASHPRVNETLAHFV